MLDELSVIFEALDARATKDQRLEEFRVPAGGPAALEWIPEGWFCSGAIRDLAVEGGWWPGWWLFGPDESGTDDALSDLLAEKSLSADARNRRRVHWAQAGNVWESDHFYTPLMRQPVPTAPLMGFSSQSLWRSLVFPHELAMLEAFLITYDELGFDDDGLFNTMFVEWLAEPPANLTSAEQRVSEHLIERSTTWRTDHPCWNAASMPLLSYDSWPPAAAAPALGLDLADLS